MTQKYIIGKEDLPKLIKGEELPLSQGSKARAFKIEIIENLTNGDMIMAMFPNAEIDYHEKSDLVDKYVTVFLKDCDTCQDYSYDWWNEPYQKGE